MVNGIRKSTLRRNIEQPIFRGRDFRASLWRRA